MSFLAEVSRHRVSTTSAASCPQKDSHSANSPGANSHDTPCARSSALHPRTTSLPTTLPRQRRDRGSGLACPTTRLYYAPPSRTRPPHSPVLSWSASSLSPLSATCSHHQPRSGHTTPATRAHLGDVVVHRLDRRVDLLLDVRDLEESQRGVKCIGQGCGTVHSWECVTVAINCLSSRLRYLS
jgi:hypothetical protein